MTEKEYIKKYKELIKRKKMEDITNENNGNSLCWKYNFKN